MQRLGVPQQVQAAIGVCLEQEVSQQVPARNVQSTCCYYVVSCPNVNCCENAAEQDGAVDPGARRHHNRLTYLTRDVLPRESLLCVLVNSKV